MNWLNRLVHGAEHHRAYLYRIATAIAGGLIAGGLASGTQAGIAVSIVGAVLGVPNGLAAVNTSTKPPDPAPNQD